MLSNFDPGCSLLLLPIFPLFPPPPSQPLPTILPDANCIAPLPQQPIASLPSPTSNRPPSCSITLEEENSKASPGANSQIGFPSNPAPVWQVRKPQAASASPAPAMVQPPLQSSPTWDPGPFHTSHALPTLLHFPQGSSNLATWDLAQIQLLHTHLDSLLRPSQSQPLRKSYASYLSPLAVHPPPALSPPVWKDGKLTLSIPKQIVAFSKESFTFSAIEKFVGRRPLLEQLEQWVKSTWHLSKPCLISLAEKGNFIFRFNTPEDRDCLISQSPLLMDKRKLLLQPWLPGQDESSWPKISRVWIRLKGLPYHCWSSDILLSIAGMIGKPIRLDETTASQRMLSYARVLVNLDVASVSPSSITVELEGDVIMDVAVQYENVPCAKCLSSGHISPKCPFRLKSGLLPTLQKNKEDIVSQATEDSSQAVPSEHQPKQSGNSVPTIQVSDHFSGITTTLSISEPTKNITPASLPPPLPTFPRRIVS